ncbi:cbb3-type cytochrome oxidase assembly protein CcoS [Asticcacaulis sp. BYS171W]|uniref:Cbb3-type cytochrome oxidase assembly protein CcoS n=1 Tax=Asticcacaulis aquaticus TaxID=2984212 RepID=A0ABT5HYW4_9CAUL|nr:cbb3-type cytochrome oxidase assembly protein CcoS [Asticcacaulis aquaticus]MDC7685271.1 cbb3-type cytochrome oxidase assembly protein CcoS [Asticcacaulis aquaticus]
MDILFLLIAAAGCLALIGAAAFMWAVRTHQFDDPDMQAERILHEDDEA